MEALIVSLDLVVVFFSFVPSKVLLFTKFVEEKLSLWK
jgi:hypothetical protein